MMCLGVLACVFLVSFQSFAYFDSSKTEEKDEKWAETPVEIYEIPLERYVYPYGPESPGWEEKSMAEKYAFYKIPAGTLEAMSDIALIQAMIDYPFMSEIEMLSVSPDQMDEETKNFLREYMAGKSSAYQELLRRNTFDTALRQAIPDRRVDWLPANFERDRDRGALRFDSVGNEDILFGSFVKVFSSETELATNLQMLQERASQALHSTETYVKTPRGSSVKSVHKK